jgi:hypothetical protein
MFVIITREQRPKPESLSRMTDWQRVDLFRILTAYSGAHKFDSETIEHDLDVSSNGVRTGARKAGNPLPGRRVASRDTAA